MHLLLKRLKRLQRRLQMRMLHLLLLRLLRLRLQLKPMMTRLLLKRLRLRLKTTHLHFEQQKMQRRLQLKPLLMKSVISTQKTLLRRLRPTKKLRKI